MVIEKRAIAGSLESSDVLVEVNPGANGIEIELQSVVRAQFERQIIENVKKTLGKLGVENVRIRIDDRGAIDMVLSARIESAVRRGNKVVEL